MRKSARIPLTLLTTIALSGAGAAHGAAQVPHENGLHRTLVEHPLDRDTVLRGGFGQSAGTVLLVLGAATAMFFIIRASGE